MQNLFMESCSLTPGLIQCSARGKDHIVTRRLAEIMVRIAKKNKTRSGSRHLQPKSATNCAKRNKTTIVIGEKETNVLTLAGNRITLSGAFLLIKEQY
jgi:hypothetical protein